MHRVLKMSTTFSSRDRNLEKSVPRFDTVSDGAQGSHITNIHVSREKDILLTELNLISDGVAARKLESASVLLTIMSVVAHVAIRSSETLKKIS